MADRIVKIKQAAHNVQEQYAANFSSPSLEEDMADIGIAIFNTCRGVSPAAELACEN